MSKPDNRGGLENPKRLGKLVGFVLDTLKVLIYFAAFIGLAAILVICTAPVPV